MAKKQKIATSDEICQFWTSVLRNEEADLKDRLKVSEYLLKIGPDETNDDNITVTVKVVD